MRARNWWQNFQFCVNYPFKCANFMMGGTNCFPNQKKMEGIFVFLNGIQFCLAMLAENKLHTPLLTWTNVIQHYIYQILSTIVSECSAFPYMLQNTLKLSRLIMADIMEHKPTSIYGHKRMYTAPADPQQPFAKVKSCWS